MHFLGLFGTAESMHSAIFQVPRPMQGREVWEALGDWMTEAKPDLGPGTKQRFDMASQLQPDEVRVLPSLGLQQTTLLMLLGIQCGCNVSRTSSNTLFSSHRCCLALRKGKGFELDLHSTECRAAAPQMRRPREGGTS